MAKSRKSKDDGAVATLEQPGKTGGRSVAQAGGAESVGRTAAKSRSFFEVYKPGQGYYTRMGTAVGGGILVLGAGNFVFKQLDGISTDASTTLWVQVIVSTLIVVGMGVLLYWLVGVHRASCEFMIATEGEMKKVSWSTRSELIGSTKVVIAATLLMGVLLFAVDLVFMKFFQLIGVLHTAT